MRDLAEQTEAWVQAGHITEAQRTAILASEVMGPEAPTSEPQSMSIPRSGPRAEAFVFGMGALLALCAGLIMASLGAADLFAMILPGGVLALAGLTILLGIRGAAIIADVALLAAVLLFAAAAGDLYGHDFRTMAPFGAAIILLIGALRVTRFVIAVPASVLTFVYATGAFPQPNMLLVLLGAAVVLTISAATLYGLRFHIRAFVMRRAEARTVEQIAPADPPAEGG